MPNTIILKGNPPRFEAEANAAITPGDLLAWTSGELTPHASAAGVAEKMVAVEQDFLGGEIDDDYTADDRVQYVIGRSGDVLYMWLTDGQVAVVGSPLGATGSTVGELSVLTVAATTLEGAIVGYAMEALSPSGAAGRIRVRMA